MPFNALVFTLPSKVELNWTRAIRPKIAQSVQFSKIAKKLNIDLSQFFSHRKESIKNTGKFNIHCRGSPWGSRTQQQAYCLSYAHSQHTESHLGKKQPQAKIPIVFLFSQLHFNRVTSHALFYGGHLVMHSKRCAVQNQWITLMDDLASTFGCI